MSFYPLIRLVIHDRSHHVYIHRDATLWSSSDALILSSHMGELHEKYPQELAAGHHYVIILWQSENNKMTDVWIFGEEESESAGSAVSVYTFKDYERYVSPHITAADGLIVLGEEAKIFV